MTEQNIAQILFPLGSAVAAILLLQRLRVPTVHAYLLVGVLVVTDAVPHRESLRSSQGDSLRSQKNPGNAT